MLTLPPISNEQQLIIQKLIDNNVIIDSVAGSGKTTTNLYIAKFFSNLNILLLTYNAKLKIETREKVNKLGITNIETHSYHSFCVKYYDNNCFIDKNISTVIETNKIPLKKYKYDIIILDEAQDINPLYYSLICKIYNDNNKETKICILGDKNQSIFDFNKADQRFITFADNIFNFNNTKWAKCYLSTSFRITNEMSQFINNCMFNNNRIISHKISNNKPRYIICNTFQDNNPLNEIKYYLDLGYLPEEIFILAPSVKGQLSPIRYLENRIKKELTDILVYIPTSDDEKMDEDIVKGKLVFSTFHQTKGLERKVVIIFNFDESYFKYYKTNIKNKHICPNELYVATTRALERLTLLHNYTEDYLPFVNKNKINIFCDVITNRKIIPILNKDVTCAYKKISVTDLIKHANYKIIDECLKLVKIEIIQPPISIINIPLNIKNNTSTENVSEITGTAIPSFIELKMKGSISIYNNLIEKKFEEKIKSDKLKIHVFSDESSDESSDEKCEKYNLNNIKVNANLTPNELLYISNCWNTFKNGFLFKIYQIEEYNWLSQINLNKCIDNIDKSLQLTNNCIFEHGITIHYKKYDLDIIGYIDCLDQNNVYEFKCVQKLSTEHYLQLAVYMYLYEHTKIKQIESLNNTIDDSLQNVAATFCSSGAKKVENSLTQYCIGTTIEYIYISGEIKKATIKRICKNGNIYLFNKFNKNIVCESKNMIIKNNVLFENQRLNVILQNTLKYNEPKKKELYDYQNNTPTGHVTNYYLYNILTNERIQISSDVDSLSKMIDILVDIKYNNQHLISDEDFIKNNDFIKNKFITF